MKQYFTQRYKLTLVFQAPFLSQASGTLVVGQDVAMQRYQKLPAINGSLVRGNIRGVLESFVDTVGKEQPEGKKLRQFINSWFGKPPRNQDNQITLTNERSRIAFDLFWVVSDKQGEQRQRTRIQLDETGKVKQGALQVIEDCFPVGSEPVSFHGELTVNYSHNASQQRAEKVEVERHLQLALASIPAMGSLKGIGFGKLERYELKEAETEPVLVSDTLSGDESCFEFRFTLDRPFCLGKPRTPDSNRIVSDEVITGNVLKGVIANQFKDQTGWDTLCFDDLSFSHAVPRPKASLQALAPLPLSLAFYDSASEKDILFDFAEVGAVDLDFWARVKQAPIFQPDWKATHFDKANQARLGAAEGSADAKPERLLLVRTGIDHSQGVSAERQLFSVECVEPKGFVWSGQVDLSAIKQVDKRRAVLEQLRELFAGGLTGIGKTQAAIKALELSPVEHKTELPELQVGDKVAITLSTAGRLMRQGFEYDDAPPTARDLYEAYWSDVSDGKLSLSDFYAQQVRSGGEWHHSHFQLGQNYMPEWLSQAGSVFVLVVNDVAVIEQLQQWQRVGLPVANNVCGLQQPTWEETPYLPEHGFGRITVAQLKRTLDEGC